MKVTEKPIKKVKKNKKTVKPVIWAALLLIMVTVLMILVVFVWFKIEKIEVYGESIYSENEIISTSDIVVGKSMILLKTKPIETYMTQRLPYIKTAKVEKCYPSTVRITIASDEEYGYYYNDGEFIVFDDQLKVLSVSDSYNGDAIPVKVNLMEDVKPGDILSLDTTEENIINDLNNYAELYELDITMIDTLDNYNIKFVVDDRLYILFGKASNINSKMEHLKTIIEQVGTSTTGTINFEYWSTDNTEAIFVKEDIRKYIDGE